MELININIFILYINLYSSYTKHLTIKNHTKHLKWYQKKYKINKIKRIIIQSKIIIKYNIKKKILLKK